MPNFTNSTAPHTPSCEECGLPSCKGVGKPRIFNGWRDLSSHLDEEQITYMVNRLVEIEPHYQELLEARRRREEQRANEKTIKSLARSLSSEQIEEWKRAHAPRPTIVTVPMRSRMGGGK